MVCISWAKESEISVSEICKTNNSLLWEVKGESLCSGFYNPRVQSGITCTRALRSCKFYSVKNSGSIVEGSLCLTAEDFRLFGQLSEKEIEREWDASLDF